MIFERGEASTSLCHILRQLPPPPKATPPPRDDIIVNNNNNNSSGNSNTNGNSHTTAIIQSSLDEFESRGNTLTTAADSNSNVMEETSLKNVVSKNDATEKEKKSRSLFERQLHDILDATVGQKTKRQNGENTKTKTGKSFLKLFTAKSDRKTVPANDGVENKSFDLSDTIRSAPSSPSTLRRFFRRSSFQKPASKMSKSRSETSLNAGREKSPKNVEENTPKKVGLKRSKSLNDGQSETPKVVPKSSLNPFEDSINVSEKLTKKVENPYNVSESINQLKNSINLEKSSTSVSEKHIDREIRSTNPFESSKNLFEKSTNPFENDESENEPIYQTIYCETIVPKQIQICSKEEQMFERSKEKKLSSNEHFSEEQLCKIQKSCFDCHLIQNGTNSSNRVVSVYENLEEDEIPEIPEFPPARELTISELIAECEDYVKTEQFTRDQYYKHAWFGCN